MMLLLANLLPANNIYAISPEFYSSESRLATGKWAKVKISETGMTLITDAQLRNLGFNNPEKVHVFGLGGRVLNMGLTEENHDDLPLLPSVRTSKGLVFFAVDNITWTRRAVNANTPYSHTIHPYSDDTWYFVSDIDIDTAAMELSETSAVKVSNSETSFSERLLHEVELEPAGESGSQVWGEDFRSKKSQTFSFTLPDMAEPGAIVKVRFGAKTVSGTSSILLTANGQRLPATNEDKIKDSSTHAFGRVTESVKIVDVSDGKLDLKIDYSYSGVLYKARLDYIETFYERQLKLNKGELHFYTSLNSGQGVTVSGCSATTQIWDVTDPVKPLKVEFTLEGDKASFMVTSRGAREFVAFDPESISRAVTPAGAVANQNLHALPVPDMLIITYQEYRDGAERIARVHETHDGMRVHVLNPDEIYNEFSGGKPDVGAFRRLMKMWHDRGADEDGHKLRYALIMGKTLNDNKCVGTEAKSANFKPMPMWQSYDGLEETESYSNDAWLGMLDDVTDARFMMKTGVMHVPVGRIPCKNATEALDVAAKIEKYVLEPDYGEWRNKVMIIADDDDRAQHLNQAQNVYNALRSAGNGSGYLYDRNYLDSYSRVMTAIGVTYPQATQRMLDNYNEGVMFTNYIGHASSTNWGHEHLWEWPQIQAMNNKRLPFIYAATCSFAYWDNMALSGAESLLLNPTGGVIGMIAAARTVYISLNGDLNTATMQELFARADDGGPLRWGDVFVRGQNKINDTNSLRYAFIGDPAVRVPGGSSEIRVEKINGIEVDTPEAPLPELEAMSSAMIEGAIVRPDGTVDSDFNGTVNLQLYDGERVITTLGQGSQGEVKSYNDRDKRLAAANAAVHNGRWKAVVRIPPEIQGNYTTALLSCYAWSDKGREANGAFDNFYVYGFNESSDDKEGPDIEAFYVNNPNMGDGAVVSRNMMVFARLRDKSGINMSQAGIGHSLTLCIDGKEYIDGISQYFSPDLEDPDLGMLTYPLNEVEPGRHTLTLTAWDNANNMSTETIEIEVGASVSPTIFDITALTDDTSSSVDFRISIDRPNSAMSVDCGIYDLNGRRLWDMSQALTSDMESVITARWDYRDKSGVRVPRGIYIFRATVEAPDGTFSTKSKKIAVSALETQ